MTKPIKRDASRARPDGARPECEPPATEPTERDPLVRHGAELRQNLVDAALRGDAEALRWCAKQIDPARRKLPLTLPPLRDPADLIAATAELVAATLRGDISAREARDIASLLELHLAAVTADAIDAQLNLIRKAPR